MQAERYRRKPRPLNISWQLITHSARAHTIEPTQVVGLPAGGDDIFRRRRLSDSIGIAAFHARAIRSDAFDQAGR